MFYSKMFTSLKFQESPKLFWKERLLGSSLFLRLNRKTIYIDYPSDTIANSEAIMRFRGENLIVFEKLLDSSFRVHRYNGKEWSLEKFYGYPVLENYFSDELSAKISVIKRVLEDNINQCILKQRCLHGDFTHFNALITENEDVLYIDDENLTQGKPIYFDFIHFIVYLIQGVLRTTVLSKKQKVDHINQIIMLFNVLNREYFSSTINKEEIRAELQSAPGIQSDTFEELLSFFDL